jgi:hypothetical protein
LRPVEIIFRSNNRIVIVHAWLYERHLSVRFLSLQAAVYAGAQPLIPDCYGFNLGGEGAIPECLRRTRESCCGRLRGLEKKVQYQTYSVHLLIRALTGVVLVLVVGIELDVLVHRQQATRIQICGADF